MTKAEEMKVLEQVRKLIEPTWYIKTAFENVFDYAERNIADDAGYNPVEELNKAYADSLRKDAEMGAKLIKLEHERDVYAEQLKQSREAYEEKHKMWCKATDAVAELEKTVDDYDNIICNRDVEIENLKSEIIHLKAELYDYMRKE